ncbi:MAG: amidase [Pyrinomonadaceae bacterium]
MRSIDRREFVGIAALGAIGAGSIRAGELNTSQPRIAEATISDLQALMASGELTSVRIVESYLDSIKAIDKDLHSIVETNPDALMIAEKMDAERATGRLRGKLHGIPVVIKDNIDTADRMKTTAGSLALLDAPLPTRDAFLVEQLRNAGAIILAKTNLSEWANFRSSGSSSGWSARGGQTRSPYILDRNPCGSSSGTAAAIAANLAAVGVGTETDGSIVCPSSISGIVGLKPTVGLISRSGIIPISHTQDTAGPMTRTVADAAALLSAITAADPLDKATARNRSSIRNDYEKFLIADGLKGAKIGVARDFWGKRPEVDAVMNAALEAMKNAGATLIDVKIPTLGKFGSSEFEVLLYEFKDGLERYLKVRGSKYATLDELIQFNKDNAAKEMPYFKQEIFEQAAKKGPLTSRPYLQALKKCGSLSRKKGIDNVMNDHGIDAIAAPSNAPAWMTDLVSGDCGGNYVSSSSLAAVAGYPNITVPAGFVMELPIGISFFGRAYSEGILLKIAYSFEQTTKARRAPKFLATAG